MKGLLAMDYISPRDPPQGFEQWLRFAKQNQCHLGPYWRIEQDLKVSNSLAFLLTARQGSQREA